VAAIAVVAAGWQLASACAPDFARAVFSYVRHPDLPRTEFIDGRLGVLQPTFARSYLVIAYRYFNGMGMSRGEREQARDYYKDRETGRWDRTGTDWPARWRAVRAQIKSPAPPQTTLITGGQLAYDPETHNFSLNCADGAFRIAVQTLEARRSRFGAQSPALREWVAAQDAVFANCDRKAASAPQPAPADAPALIRADREYQIAAAHFYAGDDDTALREFRHIARDHASPWSTISRYLVVRTMFRMTDAEKSAAQAGEQLHTEAQAILADSRLASIHGMTWNILERANIRGTDQVWFRSLARLLSTKGQDDGLREELWNYTDMYDHVIGAADPNAIWRESNAPAADVSRFRDADLTDWIFSFQARDSAVFAHSVARWQQTRSTAWLVAALGHAGAKQAKEDGLLDAAATVPQGSAGYLTARFQLFRMELELGDRSEARGALDALLSGSALNGLPSSTNLFRGLRMLAAPTLNDFVAFATRIPVMITFHGNFAEAPGYYDEGYSRPLETGALLDIDATRALNRKTPFRVLKEVAVGSRLPAELRREALLTAFTRGLMLDQDLPDVARALGEIDPAMTLLTNAYLGEADADGRRFAAAFLILHHPEARPFFASGITRQSRPGRLDAYRDNWWCPMDVEMELDSRANTAWYTDTPNLLQKSAADVSQEFLPGDASAEADREMQTLKKLGGGEDFLGHIVLRYAHLRPDDARIPEALHWVVRAGRSGCSDVNTWKATRAAFRLLHLRYGKTGWAKRTPTWFKD
jgi:hypothetical protein